MRSLGNWAAMAHKCGLASGTLVGLERPDFNISQLRVHLLQAPSRQPGIPRTVAGAFMVMQRRPLGLANQAYEAPLADITAPINISSVSQVSHDA